MTYQPPFTLTAQASKLMSLICEYIGRIEFILQSVLDVLIQNIEQSDQVSGQVSDQVKKLLSVMSLDWISREEIMLQLNLSHQGTFRKNYLNPALEAGLVIMQNPNSPKSPQQKYRKISYE